MSRLGDALTVASHAANLARGAAGWKARRDEPERRRLRALRQATRLRRIAVRREGKAYRVGWIRTAEQLRAEADLLEAEAAALASTEMRSAAVAGR